jgi:hypothetical protein
MAGSSIILCEMRQKYQRLSGKKPDRPDQQ